MAKARDKTRKIFLNPKRVADLYVFVVLAREGSVEAASHVLGSAQSTITDAHKRLVEDLKEGPLLVKSNRNENEYELTSAGRIVYNHAFSIYESVGRLETYLSKCTGYESERHYSFAHTPIYAGAFLRRLIENITMVSAGAVPQSWLVNEGVDLKTSYLNEKNLHSHLTRGSIDFFLGREMQNGGSFVSVELGTDQWKILFHHSYADRLFRKPGPEPGPIDRRIDISRTTLFKQPFILVEDRQLEHELKSIAPQLRIGGRASDYNSLLHQLLNPQFHVAIVPSQMAEHALIQYPSEFSYADLPTAVKLRPYRMFAYLSDPVGKSALADFISGMLTSVSEVM